MHCLELRKLTPRLLTLRPKRFFQPLVSPTTARFSQSGRNMASNTEDNSFVLEEHNHVPVAAPGLKKDQLKEWPPFKVRPLPATIP